MINSPNEHEPDVLNTFVQHGFKSSKFYQECSNLLALFATQKFAVFDRQFLLEYYTKRATNLTM